MSEADIRRKVEKKVRKISRTTLGLTLTDEFKMIGAREGDVVEVIVDGDGTIRIRRVDKNEREVA